MLLYMTVIFISIAIISVVNILLSPELSLSFAVNTVLSVSAGAVAVIAIDGTVAFIIRRLTPTSWFSADKKIFKVSKKERDFYRSLKIKSWKNSIPELGGFTNFHKDKLESTDDRQYLERFILESNYGVVIHLANAALGFGVMFIPFCSSPGIWMPIFSVNFILSLLPVAVLRYTSYTLQNLYARSSEIAKIHC